ncbi:PilN domain-containing protein [Xylophilus sp. GOD-11R]|uniref:PilN domain-containing protein n=1 Tax=Xylophilus sp. GOD-11R TaxID=3089814 RepID=UPI00298CC6AC|nr:PilN domain-containing protein [Xylophilus sp. GOD-11R]WPB57577.1 PilN domain-containing protein [Xylophilus sp. GOD-11R]
MILINLLPHREAARKRRREAFNAAVGASVLVGALLAGAIYLYFQTRINDQNLRNQTLQGAIRTLEGQIKEIATIESEITALRARQKAVEDLQSDRNLQVYLLNELVRQLPDGVYLTDMRQVDQTVTLKGSAQSNERVSELLRNLGNNTPYFSKPQLIEIVTGSVTLGPRDQRRVANFTISVRLLRSSEMQAAAVAAPAGAAASVAAPAAAAAAR